MDGKNPRITSIKPIPRNKNLYSIEIDGHDWIDTNMEIIREFQLAEGEEVNARTMTAIEEKTAFLLCRSRALKYLTGRVRTESEVKTYLQRKGYSPDIIQQVLLYLRDKGFVDDAEYCRLYIEDKSRRDLWGPKKIEYALLKKGIYQSLVSEKISELYPEYLVKEVFELYFTKQLKRIKEEYSRKNLKRLFDSCIRAGFPVGLVNEAISKFRRKNG